ncbi:MAG: HRDC domain-containing protein, partial [Nocardioidaceae bacterium]
MSQTPQPAADDGVPLLRLRDGLPPVVDTDAALTSAIDAVALGTGPVAVDAERASGYRYSSRAYLVQLRRAGASTALVDPLPFDDLAELGSAIVDVEWVLHAASQDLPCLAEIGMRPRRIFDTELAGRLLNYPRVGLASMVEELLGYRLRKEHSAVDWSVRPLPGPWLSYAALDVEMLLELRDAIHRQLVDAGKLGWATEEFDALAVSAPAQQRSEPWRRTSGIHRVRGRRALAVVRAVWEARDAVAAENDVAPSRILRDAAIVEAATAQPASRGALAALGGFRGRGVQRHLPLFAQAIDRARQLPDTQLPALAARYDGPPPAKVWADRDPAAAARLSSCREAVGQRAEQHQLP